MNFNKRIQEYLIGSKFSQGLEIKIGISEKSIISRFSFLENLVKNKKIVHLGCCDHIELIDEKIKNNTWLHKILDEAASKCFGIDINENGINYLKQKLGYTKIRAANILTDSLQELTEDKWDYLILGEILEHIDDPVSFLGSIRIKYVDSIEKIIITVPNAFCYTNFLGVYKNIELINSDHRYWFTPYTLAKVLNEAGYTISEYHFAQEVNEKIGMRAKLKVLPYIKRRLLYKKLKCYPGFRDTLMMIAEFK